MPSTNEARKKLAALMEERRTELRLRWQDVAEAGQVSLRALQAARTGTAEIRPLTQRGIEDGLQWPAGYIQSVLEGREPVIGGQTTQKQASASAGPEPPAGPESDSTVPPQVASAISDVLVQVNRARMRHGNATAEQIFTDLFEVRAWNLAWPEPDRIEYIAWLRVKRADPQAGEEAGRTPRRMQLRPPAAFPPHIPLVTARKLTVT
jgi:hypothetical protein